MIFLGKPSSTIWLGETPKLICQKCIKPQRPHAENKQNTERLRVLNYQYSSCCTARTHDTKNPSLFFSSASNCKLPNSPSINFNSISELSSQSQRVRASAPQVRSPTRPSSSSPPPIRSPAPAPSPHTPSSASPSLPPCPQPPQP